MEKRVIVSWIINQLRIIYGKVYNLHILKLKNSKCILPISKYPPIMKLEDQSFSTPLSIPFYIFLNYSFPFSPNIEVSLSPYSFSPLLKIYIKPLKFFHLLNKKNKILRHKKNNFLNKSILIVQVYFFAKA